MSADPARPLFRPLIVLAMIVVGAIAFGAVMVLSAYQPQLSEGEDGRAHALSRSAVGYAGLVRLLRETGVTAEPVRSRGRDDSRSLLIATPEPSADAEGFAKLDSAAPRLVILPKWQVTPMPLRSGWVRKEGLLPPVALDRLLGSLSAGAKVDQAESDVSVELRGAAKSYFGRRFSVGPVDRLQTLSGPKLFPLLTDANGRVVLARVSPPEAGRPIYVLSEPDLVSNHGLQSVERAIAADAMIQGLRSGDGPVAFDTTLNGFEKGRSLLQLAFEPPFLAATLCALAAALLTGLQAAVRFGPARRPERALALGKRALADNAAGLIRLAGREHAMGGRYAALVRDKVARAVGAPRDLADEQLETFLDRLAARAGVSGRISALTTAARQARDPAALLRAAQDLHRWRSEMTLAR